MAQRQPDKQGLANQGQPLGSSSQGMKVRHLSQHYLSHHIRE